MRENLDIKAWGGKLAAHLGQYKYVLLVILVGMVLLLLPSLGGEKESASAGTGAGASGVDFNLDDMERRLADALSQIDGAGKTQVILTLKGGVRQVLARDETISERESSSTTVVVSKTGGGQDAVTLQEVYPQYQGALIICPGGGEAAVKLKITEAVAAVTGLGPARISVCQGIEKPE